MEEDKSLPRP